MDDQRREKQRAKMMRLTWLQYLNSGDEARRKERRRREKRIRGWIKREKIMIIHSLISSFNRNWFEWIRVLIIPFFIRRFFEKNSNEKSSERKEEKRESKREKKIFFLPHPLQCNSHSSLKTCFKSQEVQRYVLMSNFNAFFKWWWMEKILFSLSDSLSFPSM